MKTIFLLLFIVLVCAWDDECSLDFNNNHCGEYGKKCVEGKACFNGHCMCPLSLSDCNDMCVNTQCDINHCGNCGTKCLPNQACINGVCTCPNTNNACDATCAPCGNNEVCINGACTCPNTPTQCSSVPNCGACLSSQSCVNGVCACCADDICTLCPPTSTGCHEGCCILTGSRTCNADCCSGPCTAGLCSALGCAKYTNQVSLSVVSIAPFTPAQCLAFCQDVMPAIAFYSLTLLTASDPDRHQCFCYSSSYQFTRSLLATIPVSQLVATTMGSVQTSLLVHRIRNTSISHRWRLGSNLNSEEQVQIRF